MQEELKEQNMEENNSTAEDEVNSSNACKEEGKETLNLAKSKYRFQNRRRQGFSLTLSTADYLVMAKGKTLNYYNAKMGSFMQVRIAEARDFQAQQSIGGNQPCINQDKQESVISMGTQHDNLSYMTSDDGQDSVVEDNFGSNDGEECSSQSNKHTYFCFSANPKLAARTKRHHSRRITLGLSPSSANRNKRRKTLVTNHSPSNISCEYRFARGKKRKAAYPPAMESYQHSRKRERHSPPLNNGCPGFCTSVCNGSSFSTKEVVSSCTKVRSCPLGCASTMDVSCVSSVMSCTNLTLKLQGHPREEVEQASKLACVARKE